MNNPNIKNESNKPSYGEILPLITKHPFIVTAVLCLLSATLTTGAEPSFISLLLITVGIFFLGTCAGIYIEKNDIKKNSTFITAAFIFLSAVIAFIFYLFVFGSDSIPYRLLNVGIVIIFGVFVYLTVTDRLTHDKIILLIFAAGFLIRLVYIMYTPVYSRQHDVRQFGDNDLSGHSGYIEYIYKNWNVPDCDVRQVWQFYHPPLHHIIAAVWLKIQTLFGISYKYACENIQILTLFYSSCCMILSYKIFRRLNLKKSALAAACAIISFCPTFFILSGSVNNDILSITFMLGAVLNTIYWYSDQKFKYIICIALCIGLGMMTKLSVWMAAPAVAFVFIYVFFKNIKNFKKYLIQFLTFGVICVPLGLWWEVRNYIKYGVPFSYVPMLSSNSDQYVGNIPAMQRLFDFNFSQFQDVGEQFASNGLYNEYNPLVGMFKTSMFDEGITVTNYPGIAVWNKVLFWSAVIIGLIGFVSMVIHLIKKGKELDIVMKLFILLLYSTVFVSYYGFCISFEHVCTQNIRYAVPLIVIGAYFVGLAIQRLDFDKKKGYHIFIMRCIYAAVGIFSASSLFVYDIVSAA